jgi:hypothetical protein
LKKGLTPLQYISSYHRKNIDSISMSENEAIPGIRLGVFVPQPDALTLL